MKIVFATNNPGKLHEALAILGEGFELVTPAEAGITEEIPETGNTLRANSLQKAQYIYDKTGMDALPTTPASRWTSSAAIPASIPPLRRPPARPRRQHRQTAV